MSVLRLTEEQYAARAKKARTRAEVPPPVPAHAKYKNRPVGGYASVKESRRAEELKMMQKAGQIGGLREQVVYELIPKQGKERACKYVADFVYFDWSDGPAKEVVEDVKSPASRTPAYIIKRKLMLQVFGIRVRET